jgi:hypothetical protein
MSASARANCPCLAAWIASIYALRAVPTAEMIWNAVSSSPSILSTLSFHFILGEFQYSGTIHKTVHTHVDDVDGDSRTEFFDRILLEPDLGPQQDDISIPGFFLSLRGWVGSNLALEILFLGSQLHFSYEYAGGHSGGTKQYDLFHDETSSLYIEVF